MSTRTVTACALGLVLFAVVAAPASAQTAAKGDIEGAYHAFDRIRDRGVFETYDSGWHAGGAYRVTSLISLLAEVGGDYHDRTGYTSSRYIYAGGVRFSSGSRSARVSPFAQILMGAGQDNGTGVGVTNRYPVVSPGGGVDVRLASHLDVRTRFDFPLYMTFGDVFKGARLGIGIAIPLGKF